MTANLDNLIEALRNELQQYGEMLALLDHQQQDLTTPRPGDAFGQSVADIRAQSLTIQAARQRRQSFQQQLARTLQQPGDCSLTSLVPLLPEQYRPLIEALVQENHELLQRVGQRARQNQHTLQQSLEMMHHFIATLSLPDLTGACSPDNSSPLDEAGRQPCCEAVA